MKLKHCRLLVLTAFALVQWLVIQALPVVPLMTRLAFYEKKFGPVHAPDAWHFVANPSLCASLIIVSIACVLLIVRGLSRKHEARREWMPLLAASVFLLVETVGYTIWVQRMSTRFAALGVK